MAPHSKGFTLIELLVVVTIIVVLLALLTPALDRAIEQAERAVCASRLHAFGIAVPQHALDNKRRLLSSAIYPPAIPFPIFVRAKDSDGPNNGLGPAGQWSAEAMKPYMANFDPTTMILGKSWYCPSSASDMTAFNQVRGNQGSYMVGGYSYFARFDQSNNRAYGTRPDDLTGRSLSSSELLMADNLYTQNGAWQFNHSLNGYSVVDAGMGGPIQSGKPALDAITGLNHLYGDGSVAWRGRSEFDTDAMDQRSFATRWVGSDPGPSQTSLYFHFY